MRCGKSLSRGADRQPPSESAAADEYQTLQRLLRTVELKQGRSFTKPRPDQRNLLSDQLRPLAVTVMLDGAAIEVATVGNEGLSGLPALAAITTSPHRVFVQSRATR